MKGRRGKHAQEPKEAVVGAASKAPRVKTREGSFEGKKAAARADKCARGGGIHIKPSHEGLLRKNLGVKAGKKIPAEKLEKAKHSKDPAIRKRATFAENAKHWNHG